MKKSRYIAAALAMLLLGFTPAFQFVLYRKNIASVRELAERLDSLEAKTKEEFAGNYQYSQDSLALIRGDLRMLEKNIGQRVTNTNRAVIGNIERIDQVYSDVLTEQKKRTIDDMYSDDALEAQTRQGIACYHARDYARAHQILQEVATRQAENHPAAFYSAASLFNINRQDTGKYSFIKSEIERLALLGYVNPEMDEVRAFILAEENAAAMGVIGK